ncbi:hypothetical protein [Cellulomonas aerilata]|uniref:hypothetical protein n=1 Tax=Cellulomonas aerilata TaxID=515326 RepID=UPI0011BD9865|nr:hypothetical protein [Cellulomonas aerilata]
MTLPRPARAAATVVAVSALVACTSAAPEPDAEPTPSSSATPAVTPAHDVADDVAAADPAAVLLAAAAEPLDSSVLPPGFHDEDSVEVDDGTDAVSTMYGGPDGPTGPTIWLHTDIGRDYTTDRQAGVTWTVETGFADGYAVRSAEGGDDFAFVDIDAEGAVDASVQLVARDVPIEDLRGTALRMLSAADGSAPDTERSPVARRSAGTKDAPPSRAEPCRPRRLPLR